MTPNERRDQLRAELAALGTREDDITFRLLDRVDHWTRAVDLDCMLAVDTILALRDQIAACRTIIEVSDREVEEIRSQVERLRDMLPEETTDV
jgi:hypothetical protein